MTIVAGLFLLLFGRLLGPRRGAAAAALGIAAYTLMASLFLLARRTPGYPFSRLRV